MIYSEPQSERKKISSHSLQYSQFHVAMQRFMLAMASKYYKVSVFKNIRVLVYILSPNRWTFSGPG
jgi:hypothetical protein